jgi:UPF0755 protein
MRKIVTVLVVVLVIISLIIGMKLFGSSTNFSESKKYLYIQTGKASKEAVMSTIKDSAFIKNRKIFEFLAGKLKVWQRLRPGRYEIKKGESLYSLIQKLRSGNQSPVNLIITKLRTKKDLASLIAKKFESDSTTVISFFNNNDSLKKFGIDTNTFLTAVLPNTYSLLWNSSPQKILSKLNEQKKKFWNTERIQKATKLGLTPDEVQVLASIVEEETIRHDEKPDIAAVYLNRLKKGMKLGADPTVKFAVGDFTLKRILFSHINSTASSPYNTYKNAGLPPGPICTASEITIDAVLNARENNYLFFCAKPNGNGYHTFSETAEEHYKNAKAYQLWLDSMMIK